MEVPAIYPGGNRPIAGSMNQQERRIETIDAGSHWAMETNVHPCRV